MTKEKNKGIRKLSVADWFTVFRIVGSISLIFIKPFSVVFFVMYGLCGVSDVFDGMIARATKTVSSFGAKLDSVADLLFYSILLLKIFPTLWEKLPVAIWYGVATVLVIRISAYIVAAAKYHRFASSHTYLNKLTGLMIFFVPCVINLSWAVIYCWVICAVSGISSLNELIIYIFKNEKTAS